MFLKIAYAIAYAMTYAIFLKKYLVEKNRDVKIK